MKCIKQECSYYSEHDFRSSCFTCGLEYNQWGRSKDSEHECIVNKKIDETRRYLKSLCDFEVELKRNQK